MPNTFCLTRASTEAQELSPDQQWDLMQRRCEALGLSNLIRLDEPLGTSGRKTKFLERPMGAWIMANIQEGDALVVTKANRLGRKLQDIWPVVERLCTRGVRIIILDYCNGQPLDISSAIGEFIVKLLLLTAELSGNLIAETTREAFAYRRRANLICGGKVPWGRRLVIKDAAGNEVPGATLIKDSTGRRRTAADANGTIIPNHKACYEWDEQQLT